ncbi:galectin-12-like [Topomyia yanbarensis]|uniref:galectin-12-like n=1 Tax=Topomyia yanbarensis TaxID=2498891 RepID=UPI00273AC411|nr:galectin-12-like [Topomyia yanbarensis]
MSERPFTVHFPKRPEIGDEIIVRGKLKSDAKVFSVNFILPLPPPMLRSFAEPDSALASSQNSQTCHSNGHSTTAQSPPYIAYHFKTVFHDDGSSIVVQNWKNIVWQQEIRSPNLWLKDRKRPFGIIFRFHPDTIKVFAEHAHHAPEYEFEYQVPLESIRTLELWDDVEFVEEVTFRFRNVKYS